MDNNKWNMLIDIVLAILIVIMFIIHICICFKKYWN